MVPKGYSTACGILQYRDIKYGSFIGKDSQDIFTGTISHSSGTFLDVFVKLGKRVLGLSCPSVCPSARNSASIGKIFMKTDIWIFL
jgi:hypothetical protein